MARYFFDIHDSVDFEDEEGVELNDLTELRNYALKMTGDLLREER